MRIAILIVLGALLVSAVPGAAAPAPGEDVILRYSFRPGERYLTVQEGDVTSSLGVADGQKAAQTATVREEILSEVLGVDAEGTARLRMTWRRVAASMVSPMGEGAYDSGKGADQPVGVFMLGFRALTGLVVEVRVDQRGRVLSLTGADAWAQKSVSKYADSGPAAQMLIKALVSDQKIRKGVQERVLVLPDTPIRQGSTWTDDRSFDGGMFTARVAGTVTVESVGPDEIRLAHVGLFPAESVKAGGMLAMAQGAKVKLEGASHREAIRLDPRQPFLASNVTEEGLTAFIEHPAMQLRQDTKGKVTTTTTRLEAGEAGGTSTPKEAGGSEKQPAK